MKFYSRNLGKFISPLLSAALLRLTVNDRQQSTSESAKCDLYWVPNKWRHLLDTSKNCSRSSVGKKVIITISCDQQLLAFPSDH